MQTLMDPERRASYDAIAGFSGNSVNPFNDTAYERNKVGRMGCFDQHMCAHLQEATANILCRMPLQVFVNEYDCIGCKNCTSVCPKTFAIEDDFGRARAMQQGG
jgi:ferredoxin